VPKVAEEGHVPANVIYSFYCGAILLLASIIWTILTTKEYNPEQLASFQAENFGDQAAQEHASGLTSIIHDFKQMPLAMRQLGLVQFFSWFALFSMWVFSTPAIAEHVFQVQTGDTSSSQYADAANWVGILFGIYNAISAIYALCLPTIAAKIGRKLTHALSLVAGGVGLLSIYWISDPNYLIFSMLGIGLAWGSILAMPYAILSDHLPVRKMGVYMGIFNFFITFPQIINGFFGGYILKYAFGGEAIYSLLLAGILMLIAAGTVVRIRDKAL